MTPEQQFTLFRAIVEHKGRVTYTHLSYTRTVFLANGWVDKDQVTQAGYDELKRKLERSRRQFGRWSKREALALLEQHWKG